MLCLNPSGIVQYNFLSWIKLGDLSCTYYRSLNDLIVIRGGDKCVLTSIYKLYLKDYRVHYVVLESDSGVNWTSPVHTTNINIK